MTKITEINHLNDPNHWLGYEIRMDNPEKDIIIKISNQQICCENFGVLCRTQNINEYVGANYENIIIENSRESYSEIVTAKIHTSKGIIEITLYNDHNGYYPHDYSVQSEKMCKIGEL